MLMGKNLADIFLKEMKQTSHFMEVLDLFMCPASNLCSTEEGNIGTVGVLTKVTIQ
jgi:hypothetical protein